MRNPQINDRWKDKRGEMVTVKDIAFIHSLTVTVWCSTAGKLSGKIRMITRHSFVRRKAA